MGCDSQVRRKTGHRFFIKSLAWLVLWVLSLSRIPGAGAVVSNADEKSFSHETVVEIAEKLSQSLFAEPQKIPEALTKIDYSTYRKINFQKNAAVWGSTPTPFSIELFAPGFLYKELIDIDVVENGQSISMGLSESSFNVPDESIGRLLAEIGKFAGFACIIPLTAVTIMMSLLFFRGPVTSAAYPKASYMDCPPAGLRSMWQGRKAKNFLCSNTSGLNVRRNITMRLSSMHCSTAKVSQGRIVLVFTPVHPPGWMSMSSFFHGRMFSMWAWHR